MKNLLVAIGFATVSSAAFAAPTIWSPDNLADFNVGPGGDRVITFDAANPATPTVIGRTGFTGSLFSGMDFDCNGNLYGYVQTGAVGLYSINQSTGAATLIGSGGVCAGTMTGLGAPVTLVQIVNADGSGNASVSGNVPQAACNRIHVQAIDGATCGTSNVIIIG